MGKIFCLFATLILLTHPAHAWHTNTHYQMTKDAVSLMPRELQTILTSNVRFVEAGIKDPDEVIRDWQNHYYISSEQPSGGGLDRVEKLIKTVQAKLQSGNQLDIGKQFCYLAHYVGDLWNPETLIKRDLNYNRDFINNERIVVFFEGYLEPIEDYHSYLVNRTEWRWRLENKPEVSRILYSEAVADIARIWLSLWQQSGKKVEPVMAGIIEHKKNALNINFEQILLQEVQNLHEVADRYRTTEEKRIKYTAEANYGEAVLSQSKEVNRVRSNVIQDPGTLTAAAELRTQEQMLAGVNPKAPFEMLDTSFKTVGDKAYFVARVRNKSQQNIASLAFMYPGHKGPIIQVSNMHPGEIVKVETDLPANARPDKIQLVFASSEEMQ